FVVESEDDPAYAVLSRILKENSPPRACIKVAGVTENCSQKIHNMLIGLAGADPRSEVFAFVDSDVRPGPHWLAHLTAPLGRFEYPASSGYRCYVPVRGGWASATRAVWNALVSTVGDPRRQAYVWGGSFALRRQAYKRMRMGRLWSKALSEDSLLTREVYRAGRKVAFVSQCMIPSHEDCTWREGFDFMRRQSLVARVYTPRMWLAGWALCLSYLVPLIVTAAAALWLLLGGRAEYCFVLAAVGLLYALDLAVGAQRRKTVKQTLLDCDFSKTRWMDTFGQVWVVVAALWALICSWRSRKMLWRGRVYTLMSPQETLVE
ncbi:MAG: hypothetical protein KAT11_05380, partial [Phycisphaerae bacterium]|nr:hypothetical protein [Phycisphaerae bacterium]